MPSKTETLAYKFLLPGGKPIYGTGQWKVPRNGVPEWMPKIAAPLVPCNVGYHICRLMPEILVWLGPELWTVEYDPAEAVEKDACVLIVRTARLLTQVPGWTVQTAVTFAADCAERVLSIYERQYPADDRPRRAIQAARDRVTAMAAGDAAGTAGTIERQWQFTRFLELTGLAPA